jgi:uncharacterized protein YlxP (DUF503 family)
MNVGVLTIDLIVYEALTLKDKRRVVKSIKDRIKNRFNVSAAEVDHLEARQRATLGVAMVSNEVRHIHTCFDRIVEFVQKSGLVSLVNVEKQML